jgi:hypothetical protein
MLIACVALAIAALARMFTVSRGFDDFTAFIVFIVVLGISVIVYLSIHVILQELMLPWIGKGLSKIPFFRNKMKSTPSTEKIQENIIEQASLEEIRNKQLQNKAKEQEEKLNIAFNYTRKTFAPYVSDEHIETLCENLQLYANKLSFDKLQSIKTNKELSTIDIFHFGWNIWNHFKVSKQIDVAYFLKKVFPDILKEVEVETIKSHLKDDDLKGIIKICENLSEQ